MLFSFEGTWLCGNRQERFSLDLIWTFARIECKVTKKKGIETANELSSPGERPCNIVINVRFMGYWFCCGKVMIKTHHLFSFSTKLSKISSLELDCGSAPHSCLIPAGRLLNCHIGKDLRASSSPAAWFRRTGTRVKSSHIPVQCSVPLSPTLVTINHGNGGNFVHLKHGEDSGIKPERSVSGLYTHIHTTFMINKTEKCFRLRLSYKVCSDAESLERA